MPEAGGARIIQEMLVGEIANLVMVSVEGFQFSIGPIGGHGSFQYSKNYSLQHICFPPSSLFLSFSLSLPLSLPLSPSLFLSLFPFLSPSQDGVIKCSCGKDGGVRLATASAPPPPPPLPSLPRLLHSLCRWLDLQKASPGC